MTLEVLFARTEQVRAFLLLAAGGAVLGALIQLAGWLHRGWRMAGLAVDALCATAAGAMLLGVAFVTGTGLRAYALLGMVTGLTLYWLGVQPVAEGVVLWVRRGAGRAGNEDDEGNNV